MSIRTGFRFKSEARVFSNDTTRSSSSFVAGAFEFEPKESKNANKCVIQLLSLLEV